MKRSNWSRLTFTAAVAVTVVGAVTGADRMHRLAKPLMVPALAAGVPRMTPALGTALAAATIGDVLLIDPDDDRRILRGAAAFAIMQGCYSSMLISRGARPTVIEAVPRYGGWAVAATLRISLQRGALAQPSSMTIRTGPETSPAGWTPGA